MILSWNVRGLNKPGKIKEISSLLYNLRPVIVILLETRVKYNNADCVRKKLHFQGLALDNYDRHHNGRIWILWDDTKVDISLVKSTSQLLHCRVQDSNKQFMYYLTAVYAMNQLTERKGLWRDLARLKQAVSGPWGVMGDFNNVLCSRDRIGGREVTEAEFVDMRNMMEICEIDEMDSVGDYFTWTNKHTVGTIYSRIDRILGNLDWMQYHSNFILTLLPPNVSDHCILHLKEQGQRQFSQVQFKFSNCITKLNGFLDIVSQSWRKPMQGRPMSVLWKKLHRLTPEMKKLYKQVQGCKKKVEEARGELLKAQKDLIHDRMNPAIISKVKHWTDEVMKWNDLDEMNISQRAKIDWLRLGDGNNAYFYASVKGRNRIQSMNNITRQDGSVAHCQPEIEQEVLDFYGKLMGQKEDILEGINVAVMRDGPQISHDQIGILLAAVTDREIKAALDSMGDNKSPGIDGFTARFFKDAWPVIGKDVCDAVKEFFLHSRILRDINCTLVTLIPKIEGASTLKEFRPISCCSTIYKLISKILTSRLGKVIGSVVSLNQAAFVPGQQLHAHVLLAFELMRQYGRQDGVPKCMMQLDMQKAYDMVEWDALETILRELSFPNKFIDWIMTVVRNVTYRFKVNGNYTSIMEAKRGIRQGDPISPLLFVLVMEYLTRYLNTLATNSAFNYHFRCEKVNITSLSFADDLLMFARGDSNSVRAMLECFHKFSRSTGLRVNTQKCSIYFGAVDDQVMSDIMIQTGFQQGVLPFRYLGIPITDKRLAIRYYLPLIEKIVQKVTHWSARLLSYAGRVQLIQSVIFSTVNFWMQCLPLPKAVIQKIEATCRSFLWTGSENISRKSPIAWQKVCRPKTKGGMSIIDLTVWSQVQLLKMLWNIHRKADNLWICWIHSYYIKGADVFDMRCKQSFSWVMKSILSQREVFRRIMRLPAEDFKARKVYMALLEDEPVVPWSNLMWNNIARPRAQFTLWLACLDRLATRERLHRFKMVNSPGCVFCDANETTNHLFFDCLGTKDIWRQVLNWFQFVHNPLPWTYEKDWLISMCKGKSWKSTLLKCAATETVYNTWKYRNAKVFGRDIDRDIIVKDIIDATVYRAWKHRKITKHLAMIMV
jgi:hypothetical protein